MDKEKTSWSLSNFIAIIILAGILIVGGSMLGSRVLDKQSQKAVAGTQIQFQPVVEKTINYDGQAGKTALDILKASHQVESQDSSIGIFVTGIDGTKNQDNKYWMFYVDGQLGATGADQYTTKDGDKIEWRYESLQ
ncbi:MAG: hypothetical protein US31_C0028G0002 [Berkelbacteria bacterium GW2011_GWA1_36_9]|uniref:Transcobalamin-like C-terminal domain-containing protein n=1 Tax=Berkelbacteria bacterium GW2011_GWA1_36_9 TaxID=1618331 RepID=A0A0G0FG04_9BACT|nr:MAG: hypothetical protein US31_C0028G0002 [Berkelbacteria bacterium GW2011_GWA1_36_9]